MSFDNDLKQAFERHSGDVSPTPGAWTGVERRIRRSHRIRTALATAGGAAAIVAVTLAVPGIIRNSKVDAPPIGGGPTPPAPTGSPTTQPSPPTEGPAVYRHDESGYFVVLPDQMWRVGLFEGAVDLQPSGLPGLPEGGDTFGVEIVEAREAYDATGGTYGDPKGTPITIGGLPATRSQVSTDNGGRSIVYRIRWTDARCPGAAGSSPHAGASCPHPGYESMLRVAVLASNADLWKSYGEMGEKIVESIRATNSYPTPNLDIRTLIGIVKANVKYDTLTASLVKLLDARIIEDTGVVDEILGSEAKRQYSSHEGGLQLYDPPVPPGYGKYDYISYVIERRDDADANSAEFRLALIAGQRDATMGRFFETIGMGPGTKPAIARFARYNGCDKMYASCQDLGG